MAKNSLPRTNRRPGKSPEILHLRGVQVLPEIDHPKVVAAARRINSRKQSARAVVCRGLDQIDQDLRACRQTLMCAAEALGQAEDEGFEGESLELGVSAIRVVERCARELFKIEEMVDRLSIDAAHS
jgi:hypothetical protein